MLQHCGTVFLISVQFYTHPGTLDGSTWLNILDVIMLPFIKNLVTTDGLVVFILHFT